MQVFAIPLAAPSEPVFVSISEAVPLENLYGLLKTGIQLNLAADAGQIGAGLTYTTQGGWAAALEVQTFLRNEILVLPLPVAERFAAYLTERAAASSCDCPACRHLHGAFAQDFPTVVSKVREKIAANAPEPTEDEIAEAHKRAGEWAALHGEPAGRA